MTDSNSSSRRHARNNISPSDSDKGAIAELYDQVAELQATVEALQASRDALELDHRELQAENQRLRREMTLANLIEGLQSSLEEVVAEEPFPDPKTPLEHRLYEHLPSSFPFSAFFRMADEADVETTDARRILVRYLADGLLVQSGAYLQKREGRAQ